jgi:hypothetical protein
MSEELVRAAQDYVRLGLRVIALSGKAPNGKIHPRGLYDAIDNTSLQALIHDAFNHSHTTGIGILTSFPYVVVDIDGEEGAAQWETIAGGDYMPDRWVAKTGRGLHLWYADATPRSTTKLGAKLDLKGAGGYVAAPPSLHPDGHRYTWLLEPGDQPPMEIPPGLAKVLDDRDWEQKRRIVGRNMSKRIRHKQFEDGKWWATWGFEGLLKTVAAAEPGNRNAALYWAAFAMSEDDADEEDYEQLREAGLSAGLQGRETRLTIRSARKAAASG